MPARRPACQNVPRKNGFELSNAPLLEALSPFSSSISRGSPLIARSIDIVRSGGFNNTSYFASISRWTRSLGPMRTESSGQMGPRIRRSNRFRIGQRFDRAERRWASLFERRRTYRVQPSFGSASATSSGPLRLPGPPLVPWRLLTAPALRHQARFPCGLGRWSGH